MKKAVGLFFLLILLPLFYIAQYNLVPNSSFESYSSCPTFWGQSNFATGWNNPCTTTPDYYNSCSQNYGVPYCSTNCFQYAKSGNAYTGLYTYYVGQPNVREYIQTQLTSSLINGNCYYVGFYVNQANWSGLAINKIGVLLSNTLVSCPSGTLVINYNSQIKPFNNKIIHDTLNWSYIRGVFQSTNNENYITIGNFNLDSTTDTLIFNSNNFAQNYSYYLIDSVIVTPIDSMPSIMNAFAGNDIFINLGDSAFIGQEISNLNCEWFDGTGLIASNISGIYVKPVTTSTYTVHQNLCGKDTYDTIVVTVNINTNDDEFDIKTDEFVISPNPNNGIFKIEILNKKFSVQNSKVRFLNLFGQEVKSSVLESKNEKLNIQSQEKGIYYLQLIKNDKIIMTKRILKL